MVVLLVHQIIIIHPISVFLLALLIPSSIQTMSVLANSLASNAQEMSTIVLLVMIQQYLSI